MASKVCGAAFTAPYLVSTEVGLKKHAHLADKDGGLRQFRFSLREIFQLRPPKRKYQPSFFQSNRQRKTAHKQVSARVRVYLCAFIPRRKAAITPYGRTPVRKSLVKRKTGAMQDKQYYRKPRVSSIVNR